MTDKERNLLFAKFQGLKVYPEKDTPEFKKWKGQRCDFEWHQLEYHASWNWLLDIWTRWLGEADEYNQTGSYKNYWRIFHNCVDTGSLLVANEILAEAITWLQALREHESKTEKTQP